jgi:hypothetical protein
MILYYNICRIFVNIFIDNTEDAQAIKNGSSASVYAAPDSWHIAEALLPKQWPQHSLIFLYQQLIASHWVFPDAIMRTIFG